MKRFWLDFPCFQHQHTRMYLYIHTHIHTYVYAATKCMYVRIYRNYIRNNKLVRKVQQHLKNRKLHSKRYGLLVYFYLHLQKSINLKEKSFLKMSHWDASFTFQMELWLHMEIHQLGIKDFSHNNFYLHIMYMST